jgi:hypothetical protein
MISVTIGNSVTFIGYKAFADNQLTSVTFQGTIASDNFNTIDSFSGDLRTKYLAEGRGRYTRPNASSNTWIKQ